jgi:hypothetical protein
MVILFSNSFLSYYKVGALLHWITIFYLVMGVCLLRSFLLSDLVFSESGFLLWVFGIGFFFINIVLAQLDAFSRFQNYKQLKDQIIEYGLQKRLLKPMLRSRCQRDAAQIACNELNLGHKSKKYFSSYNYKWFHIIPDFVFTNPLFFFSNYFWRTTFFTPYYKSKIDFVNLHQTNVDFNKNPQYE